MKCTDCEKEFSSPEGLQHHRDSKHGMIKKKMVMKKNYYLYAGIAAVIILFGVWMYYSSNAPGKYDNLARCLGEKNVTFYGAFWCSHCAEQKRLFGRSDKLLPYVECSTPDGREQTSFCISKKVEGYPTWEFGDGGRVAGVFSPQQLAEKTGCELG